MATHFTKRKITRIIYFLLEVQNTICELFLPKTENLNAIKPLDLAINLQEIQWIEEHINWHRYAVTKIQTVGSITGQKKKNRQKNKNKTQGNSENSENGKNSQHEHRIPTKRPDQILTRLLAAYSLVPGMIQPPFEFLPRKAQGCQKDLLFCSSQYLKTGPCFPFLEHLLKRVCNCESFLSPFEMYMYLLRAQECLFQTSESHSFEM